MAESLFLELTKAASKARTADGVVLTEELLDTCRLILPVIDQMGTGMALVRNDVKGNIDRVAAKFEEDPAKFRELRAVIDDEVAAGSASGKYSVSRGILWLKRAMGFLVATLSRLSADPAVSLSAAVAAAYDATLKQYHGMLVYGTFRVALTIVPSREGFLAAAGAGASNAELERQMAAFADAFGPALDAVHQLLDARGLDDPTPV